MKASVVNVGLQVAEARKKRSTDDASIISLPFDKVKRFSQVNQKLLLFLLTNSNLQILILKKMTD